jgi:hypothetical protein
MATKIKKTPILEGDAAIAFNRAIAHNKIKVSADRVRYAIDSAKKILAVFNARKK